MLQEIYGYIECGEQWDRGEIGRTLRCPNCGGKCEFQENREVEEDMGPEDNPADDRPVTREEYEQWERENGLLSPMTPERIVAMTGNRDFNPGIRMVVRVCDLVATCRELESLRRRVALLDRIKELVARQTVPSSSSAFDVYCMERFDTLRRMIEDAEGGSDGTAG